ncbi:hypothetical protein TYRP_016567 [Tyrophagus putrescentiae]|nr:hypothetical protein TYRP_016567 [Tyrophagus putrescentiae]
MSMAQARMFEYRLEEQNTKAITRLHQAINHQAFRPSKRERAGGFKMRFVKGFFSRVSASTEVADVNPQQHHYRQNISGEALFKCHQHHRIDLALVIHRHAVHQLLHLVLGQLLAEGGQQVAQVGGLDEAISLVVKVAHPLGDVLHRVLVLALVDRLQDGQKGLPAEAALRPRLLLGRAAEALGNVRLGGVLAHRPEDVAHLLHRNHPVALAVKDVERLLELLNLRVVHFDG